MSLGALGRARHPPGAVSGGHCQISVQPRSPTSRPCRNRAGADAKVHSAIAVSGGPALSGYPNYLLANPKKRMAFKSWLFTPAVLVDLDRGTLDIPWEFLADRTISMSPGSGSRSANQPYLGIVTEEEIRNAIAKYESLGQRLQRIRSVDGFNRRLN